MRSIGTIQSYEYMIYKEGFNLLIHYDGILIQIVQDYSTKQRLAVEGKVPLALPRAFDHDSLLTIGSCKTLTHHTKLQA